MENKTRRLFFAFELPEKTIQTLESLQHDLQRQLRGPVIQWKSPDLWHITTHFVGEVDYNVADRLADAMQLIPKNVVTFSPWQLDVFPSRERPKYLVLRLADPSGSAYKMHKAHFPILLRENLQVNTRPWRPFIALGKILTGKSAFNCDLSNIHIPQGTFSACRLTLFETMIGNDVKYHPIEWHNLPLE